MGLLATIGLGSFMTSQIKARDSQRKSDLSQIQKALEMYYNDKGQYPPSLSVGGMGQPDAKGTLYIKQMPKDPKFGDYYYITDVAGTYYKLYAKLENVNDPKINISGYSGTSCGGTPCNYGVASANVTL